MSDRFDPSAPPRRSRGCGCVMVGCAGCLPGFVLGLAAAGVVFWAMLVMLDEEVRNPLAELNIHKERLTAEETQKYIDRLAADYLAEDNVGLVVGIVKEGKTHVYGYGSVAKDRPKAPDGDTVFEIASVGKTFTATLLADMQLRKELDWNDPLQKFLPLDVTVPQKEGKSILLIDLATHTAALPSLPGNLEFKDELNPYAHYTVPEMHAGLAATELSAPPGKRYEYSNFGFGLLGHALERHAGKSYEQEVVERICKPLAMDSTRMTLHAALKHRLATPHDGGNPVPVWEDTTMPGAGSFLSTANDMLKYVAAHLEEDGPLDEAMKATTQKRRPTDSPSDAVGLGWHITSENALDIVWHNGASGGSTSYVAFLKESKVGVVVLSNSSASVDDLGRKALYLLHLH